MSKKSVSRLYGLLLVLLAALTIGASITADVAAADTQTNGAGTDIVRLPRPSSTTSTEAGVPVPTTSTTTTTSASVPTFPSPFPFPFPYPSTTTTSSTTTTTTTRAPGFPGPSPSTTTTSTTTTTTTAAAPAPEVMPRPETEPVFLELINAIRADLGKSPLELDAGLTDYARAWAEHLARTQVVEHSDFSSLIGTQWANTGENIGFGGTEQWIMDWLVDSPPHYDTLTRFTYTHIGIGSWQDDRGLIWTVHVFAQERALLPRPGR